MEPVHIRWKFLADAPITRCPRFARCDRFAVAREALRERHLKTTAVPGQKVSLRFAGPAEFRLRLRQFRLSVALISACHRRSPPWRFPHKEARIHRRGM